jgi:c-di-GMP-binding flagellar brake protein YcgR
MSDTHTQSIVFLYWGMLMAGAGLSILGIVRGLAKYRDWWLAAVEDEGDIVIGNGQLEVGQTLILAPGDRSQPADPVGVISGQIESIGPKYYVLALDTELPDRSKERADGIHFGGHSDFDIDPAARYCAGAMVTVRVTAATEIFRFTTKIQDVQATADGTRLFVSRPRVLARIQRRRHVRVNLNVPATFERVSTALLRQAESGMGAVRMHAPLHGTVRNISSGGLHAQIGGVLRIHELDMMLGLFQPESTVCIGLPIPSLPRNAVLARVRSAGRAATHGGLTLQVTVEFLPMSAWDQKIINEHVVQFQREQLRDKKMRRHGSQPGICQ